MPFWNKFSLVYHVEKDKKTYKDNRSSSYKYFCG